MCVCVMDKCLPGCLLQPWKMEGRKRAAGSRLLPAGHRCVEDKVVYIRGEGDAAFWGWKRGFACFCLFPGCCRGKRGGGTLAVPNPGKLQSVGGRRLGDEPICMHAFAFSLKCLWLFGGYFFGEGGTCSCCMNGLLLLLEKRRGLPQNKRFAVCFFPRTWWRHSLCGGLGTFWALF